MLITGAATVVTLANLTVDGSDPAVAGCLFVAVDAGDGARMLGMNLIVFNSVGMACLIFGDGFEDGTTNVWGATVP